MLLPILTTSRIVLMSDATSSIGLLGQCCFYAIFGTSGTSGKSEQFWNHPKNWQSSGKKRTVLKSSGNWQSSVKIWTVLKSSGKLAVIWKNLDSFEIIRKIGSHLEHPDSFEIIWKIGNHLEKFGSFWMYWDSWQGIFLLYAQKLSGRAKTFRVAMLPCYPGFWASAVISWVRSFFCNVCIGVMPLIQLNIFAAIDQKQQTITQFSFNFWITLTISSVFFYSDPAFSAS